MVRHIHIAALLFLGAFAPAPSDAARSTAQPPPASPARLLGTWRTEDGNGVIAIETCGDALCGRIVGIVRAPGEPMPKDVHGASQCGLTIITNERPTDDGAWLGDVTDPRSGKVYGALLWSDGAGNVKLRGFLGLPLFGQTQTWRPYTGRLTSECGLA